MFRPSDERRVQAAFDTDLIPPYEAEIVLSEGRKAMSVFVRDPDDPGLTVAQAQWDFDERAPRSVKQPADDEIGAIVASFMVACSEYPARKAAEAIENAEKAARAAALAAAKAAQAEADAATASEPPPEA